MTDNEVFDLSQTGDEVQSILDKGAALPSNPELQEALSGKQDVIPDLSTIRQNAQKGQVAYEQQATVVQQAAQAVEAATDAEHEAQLAQAAALAAEGKLEDLETFLQGLDPESAASVAAELGLFEQEVRENYAKKTECVFDISAYHATGTPPVLAIYANLTAALGTDGENVPEALRKGGMSVKFVQGTEHTSDNKYVQFFCTADEFTTDVTQWQGVDDEPHGNSKNLIESGAVAQVANSLELQENYAKVEVGSIDSNGIDIVDNSRTRFVDYFPITANPSISVKVNGIGKTTAQRFYSSNTPESYIGSSYTSNANYVRVIILDNTQLNGVELTIGNTIYYSDKYKKSATKTDVLKGLVATDSDFTKPIPALLSYIAKLDIDTTKEYYLRYCGPRNGDNGATLQVYDQDDNLTDRADFNISALPSIHRIETENFVFTIDNSLIEPNSASTYKQYNYHLFKNSYKYKDAELYKKTVEPIYQDSITQTGRLTIPLLLTDYIGKSVCIKGNSSRDNDVYTIYECNDSGSLIADRILARFSAGTVSDNFVIPANGYIRVFTSKNPSTTGTLDFYLYVAECLLPRVERSEKRIEDIDYHIDGNILTLSSQSPDLTSRLSRLITLTGYAGKELALSVDSNYFKNNNIRTDIKIFECTDEGQLISDSVLATGIVNEIPCVFTVPANEYVWLYTEYNNSSASSAKFDIDIYDRNSIKGDEADIVNKIQGCKNGILDINNKKTLYGKNIVCFGDSITEFSYQGMRYSDYLAQMADANVINVGVGGTRLSQRGLFYEVFDENKTYEVDDYCIYTENDNTRIYKFTSQHTGAWNSGDAVVESDSNKAYSNIDVINMIKCACGERDINDLRAAAQILYQAESDDNRDTIERLAGIDWSTIQYVTIFAGTNDWTGGTDIGDSGSTDVSCVCGAINEIMRALLHTYPHLQLYWFTPILRVQVPNFRSGVQYNVDDVCEYNNTNYKFINAHRGAWNSNDVVQISAYEARKPEYFSDIKTNSDGATLREFSADIYEEVKLNHIPVCDMYNTLGWNRYNFSQYFRDMDGTHPYKGFKQLAEKIYKFINSN